MMRIHNTGIGLLRLLALALALALVPGAQAQLGQTSGSGNNTITGSNTIGHSNTSSSFGSNSSSSSFGRSNSTLDSEHSSSKSKKRSNRDKKNKDSKKKSKNSKSGDQPLRAQAQGKSTVVSRKSGGKKKSGGGKEALPLPEIKLDPKLIEDTVYVTPEFARVAPGDRFATSLVYFNSASHKVDEVNLWVHYDPAVLSPDWVDTATLSKAGSGPLQARIWRQEGYLHVQAKLKNPLTAAVNPLADIHWRAIKAAPSTLVELSPPAGEEVSLLAAGENVIKTTGAGNKLRVSANIHVVSPTDEQPGLQLASQVAEAMPPPPTDAAHRLRLALISSKTDVAPGEIATADVVLVNPSSLAFDELKFRIRFDPNTVKVLDADQDNYIADGTNIFDGDFHKLFPFGAHYTNQVDQGNGQIDYRVASTAGLVPYPSGTVARIVYRVVREGGRAAFWFETRDAYTNARVTDVTALGRTLLGESTGLAKEALHGVQVAVRAPELASGKKSAAPAGFSSAAVTLTPDSQPLGY